MGPDATALPARLSFTVPESAGGATLAAVLREQLGGRSWSDVRRLCTSGKVRVNDAAAPDPARRVAAGDQVELRMTARAPVEAPPGFRVAFEDAHVIVIEKPDGVSSVPYERKESGTAMDLIRAHWRAQGRKATVTPLFVVHRLDKDTSGLLCFAKTRLAERGLHRTFQQHLARREYLAVAHGAVRPGRIESYLIADRGDGLRGSTRRRDQGQHAVTHVEVIERLARATFVRVRLETGRTHQIRIHLSEAGHPLVGETVYIRDMLRAEATPLPAPRLMLHAATLGFAHPVDGEPLDFAAAAAPRVRGDA